MEIKDKIAECRAAMKRAKRLAQELDAAMDPRPRSPKLTGMPRSGQNTTLDLQMEIIEAAKQRFEAAREILLEKMNELEEKIDALEEYDQRAVMYFHYIYGWKWAEVADRMGWSERTVRRIHAKALEEMGRHENSVAKREDERP